MSTEFALGEVTVRTRKRCYQVAFAVQVHLLGYGPARNRWAFIQFGDKTYWLVRAS